MLAANNGGNMRNILVVGCMTLVVASANAQFVTSDSAAFGEDSLVTDILSGQTWLNLNVTQGMSFNNVLLSLQLNPGMADFRLATRAEVTDLFRDAGFSVNFPSGDLSDPSRLAAGASFADAFVGTTRDDGTETFRGFLTRLAPINGDWTNWAMEAALVSFAPGSATVSEASLDTTAVNSNVANPEHATWLVSNRTVSPIPEPGTYALMLAGLGALGFVAHRRKA